MMLADRLMTESRRPQHALREDVQRVADAVSGAALFEIDNDVGAMAADIGQSSYEKLVDVRRFARPPFRNVWIEYTGISSRHYAGHDLPLRDGQKAPTRCGFLIETDESLQRGMITQVWTFAPLNEPPPLQSVEINPVCMTFDWNASFTEVEGAAFQYQSGGNELDVEEMKRNGFIPNPRLLEFYKQLPRQPGPKANFGEAMRDWLGEANFIYSLLICLNSKNLVRVEEAPDLSRLNKSRRRLGRPALLSFSKVRINLSKVMARKADISGAAGDVRAHLVRGHFKVRKSGIFWWSPFVRGDASKGMVQRSGYEVRA